MRTLTDWRNCLALTAATRAVVAQPIEGCPSSKEIGARFEDFGRTGKMPPDVGRWLFDAKAQFVEPWKAFDGVHFVGVCWVSAWAIQTSDGVVLIDTLHEPHVDQLVANLGKAGVALSDIKYVLMTHGHLDHVGGAAKLKPLLTNAKFVMTQVGWDEAMEFRESIGVHAGALVDASAGHGGEGRRRHSPWRQHLRRTGNFRPYARHSLLHVRRQGRHQYVPSHYGRWTWSQRHKGFRNKSKPTLRASIGLTPWSSRRTRPSRFILRPIPSPPRCWKLATNWRRARQATPIR